MNDSTEELNLSNIPLDSTASDILEDFGDELRGVGADTIEEVEDVSRSDSYSEGFSQLYSVLDLLQAEYSVYRCRVFLKNTSVSYDYGGEGVKLECDIGLYMEPTKVGDFLESLQGALRVLRVRTVFNCITCDILYSNGYDRYTHINDFEKAVSLQGIEWNIQLKV